MTIGRLRVGLIGIDAGRSWGAIAHVPALRALNHDFEIFGVANTSQASAQRAAAEYGIPHAFADVNELISSPQVDIVAVTVKVPYHHAIVKTALAAGKHVYCEWPLAKDLEEARELTDIARATGVVAVIGLQAAFAPEIQYLAHLVGEGYLGEILSTTIVGSGLAWGPQIDRANAYLLDRSNGATMLTIPFCHAMSAVRHVLGEIDICTAMQASRRKSAVIVETGDRVAMTAPDQLIVGAVLGGGAPLAAHYRGGLPQGTGFLWEINGTEGDIQVTGNVGHPQMTQLRLAGAGGGEKFAAIEVPPHYREGSPDHPLPGNVARLYKVMAADIRSGTAIAPGFPAGLKMHELVAAVEAATC